MTPERFARLRAVLDRRQPDLTALMEDPRKTHNVAAVLRSCDAVGVPELHVVSREPVPSHHMVSAGTRKWVRVRVHEDIESAVAQLRARGHRVLAAMPTVTARDYRAADYTGPCVILLGSELRGVSAHAAALADESIAVPMEGVTESLNVSVAAALVLFEARRQREAAGLYGGGPRLDPRSYRRILFEWAWPEVAARCRRHDLPYPDLDEQGRMLANPLRALP